MPGVVAVSVRVRPTGLPVGGFARRQTEGGSDGVRTLVCVSWPTDEYGRNGRRLQLGAEIALGGRQVVSEDGRHVGLGESDRQPGFANASLVAGCKGEGGA